MLRLMRDGERPRAPELRLRARAPLPATVGLAAIRLFKNTHGSARWRLTRLRARRQTSRRKRRRLALWRVSSQRSASGWGSGRRPNRSQAPNGVRCSELALHSVLAQSPQPTNARCARGEEPKARSLVRGQLFAGSTGYKRSEFPRTISVRLPPRAERETRHPPTAP